MKSVIDLTQCPKCKSIANTANTEVNTQEICLDPLLLMNFYTNEYLSKYCLKDRNVIYGAVVQKINLWQSQDRLMIQFVIICVTKDISSTLCEEYTKHI